MRVTVLQVVGGGVNQTSLEVPDDTELDFATDAQTLFLRGLEDEPLAVFTLVVRVLTDKVTDLSEAEAKAAQARAELTRGLI